MPTPYQILTIPWYNMAANNPQRVVIALLAQVKSCALIGLSGTAVNVEVDVTNGLPCFDVVGLPDAAVREARERVRAALRNTGFSFPVQRITVNLSPGDIRKEGPRFDLPMALGVLAAGDQLDLSRWRGWAFVGELSLGGGIQPVTGALAMALTVREQGWEGLVVPGGNWAEASLATGIRVVPAGNLRELVLWLQGRAPAPRLPVPGTGALPPPIVPNGERFPDLSEVRGQSVAQRALEIGAAGGHNTLFVGPPGSGKTLLARCLPGLMPPLSPAEALEVTSIYSVAGLLPQGAGLMRERPFRGPHASATTAALVGGGAPPRPGEVTLAHHGVLFLDEMGEFARDALEALRQPLEEGVVHLSRSRTAAAFPCRFTLVGTVNPCPCGFYGDSRHACGCGTGQVTRYRARLSGPLRDRIDLHVEVQRLAGEEMARGERGEPSVRVRERVALARERQAARLAGPGVYTNAQMGRGEVRAFCRLDAQLEAFLLEACERLAMSLRGYDRVLRVARTIADLEGSERITSTHLGEALLCRGLDRDATLALQAKAPSRGLIETAVTGERT